MRFRCALLSLALALFLVPISCSHDHSGEKKAVDTHEDGPNGGHLVELGSVGHVELVHDQDATEVRAYLTGPDAKTPLTLAAGASPELKVLTSSGQKVIAMAPLGDARPASAFVATDEALGVEHLEGRVSIPIDGKIYNPDLESTHHHDE